MYHKVPKCTTIVPRSPSICSPTHFAIENRKCQSPCRGPEPGAGAAAGESVPQRLMTEFFKLPKYLSKLIKTYQKFTFDLPDVPQHLWSLAYRLEISFSQPQTTDKNLL